jgi:hypothetical protein
LQKATRTQEQGGREEQEPPASLRPGVLALDNNAISRHSGERVFKNGIHRIANVYDGKATQGREGATPQRTAGNPLKMFF